MARVKLNGRAVSKLISIYPRFVGLCQILQNDRLWQSAVTGCHMKMSLWQCGSKNAVWH